MAALGLIDTNIVKLSSREAGAAGWELNRHKDWDARAMAVHAAMVDRMDQGIGRIIAALKQEGKLDNTLIIFLSDNGASPENAMAYGPGFDRPGAIRTGERIHYPADKEVLPGPQTSFTSIGAAWANVANTPYRFAKASSFEGGVHYGRSGRFKTMYFLRRTKKKYCCRLYTQVRNRFHYHWF
ncbi:sulfatase-like hydrolase/transferase [Niabella drilacis]|uniref:Sulfatase n=1 Tax=Niabella drilacis (strain DSM 25811 / CCM 8410 / CCUG 62505 / LMG 26954 / E90) TaxID=1285928 RepID=A0A1G6U317_NIADE|nr:sulfatase-like hydrolase/transferase [Niabella drilacis]SDD35076.1 Sulfatase [Niabella drilacis]